MAEIGEKNTMKTKAKRGASAKRRTAMGKSVRSRRPTHAIVECGLPQALGIRLVSLTKKRIVGEMRITPMHRNRTGRVAGGAIMALADALGAIGSVLTRLPGHRGGTIESKTNFFAAGTGPVLSAVSIPLHVGRTTSVWQTSIKNPDGRLVAIVTQTQIALPLKSTLSED